MRPSTRANGACEHRRSSQIEGASHRPLIPAAVAHLHDQFQHYLFYLALALGCHQRQERSFSCRGRQIPLCARCLGILIGPLFAPLYLRCPNPWVAVVGISVFLVDGSTQLMGLRESNNWLRLVSGAAFSASVLFLLIDGVTFCLLNTRH